MSRAPGRQTVAVVTVERPRRVQPAAEVEAQPKSPRSGRRMTGMGLAALLAGCVAGIVWAFQTDTFRIRQLVINGASPSVTQAIQDEIVPGCSEWIPGLVECSDHQLGPNALTVSAAQLERQLQALPLVKSARVKVVLPNRIEISVTERHPEAAWLVGTESFRVADDGMVMDRGPKEGLKVAIGQVGGEPFKPGDKIDTDIIKAAELLQERLPADFGIKPWRIQYSPAEGLAVIGDQEMVAIFGPPQELEIKMAELQRIVQLARDKKLRPTFVDLRYKTPYFRTT